MPSSRPSKQGVQHWQLEEVMAGDEPGWWVTLGFTSELERHDRLHVVASEPVGESVGTGGRIYLERFDQMYSADYGATEVRVLRQCVEVDLTPQSRRALAFDHQRLSFDGADKLHGYAAAVRIFRAMEQAGYAVRVEVRP